MWKKNLRKKQISIINDVFCFSLNTDNLGSTFTLQVRQKAKKAPDAWSPCVLATRNKKIYNTFMLLFFSCYDDLVFDSCRVEVNRWYHSCFVRFQEIFIHSLSLFLHGISLFLSKILQAMPVKPRPLRSVRNIRTPQRFLAMNNALILLNQMFFLEECET